MYDSPKETWEFVTPRENNGCIGSVMTQSSVNRAGHTIEQNFTAFTGVFVEWGCITGVHNL